MGLHYAQPDPSGSERAKKAKEMRDLSTEVSRLRSAASTKANGEEADHGPEYPANFTKGLLHDADGLLQNPEDYRCFVEAINSPDRTQFDKGEFAARDHRVTYKCHTKSTCGDSKAEVTWRGWESPRAGHVYELQGADPAAVGMAPAPRVGSSELAAEMAEVYALALLRDVPFTEICEGGDKKLCPSVKTPGVSELSAAELVDLLNQMPFYDGADRRSSTPHNVDGTGLNLFERRRRFTRTQSIDDPITPETAFRGSTKGALVGPYLSQFMLIGATSLACGADGNSNYPGLDAQFDFRDGYIPYGSLIIDQRTLTHKNCLDYMTDWTSWLDVQNGADLRGADVFEGQRRFITTPRDLATYVHFDALYEAYLNAGLIMMSSGIPFSKGFPERSPSGRRDAFATFGGPHVLSLVTEVATRCLKAVRRQKFNYHRRARPEAIGGRLTVAALGHRSKLGCAGDAFDATLGELPSDLIKAIAGHNKNQNTAAMNAMRQVECKSSYKPPCGATTAKFNQANLLLPMAFPEGSPMHPAYGAGHATVAGGCVTMLKAFFEMFEDCDSFTERELCDADGDPILYVPDDNGSELVKDSKFKGKLTVQGELDKLAANISIGRNMAGVHYYSDYYDSLRMGERIAVSILMEQAPTYGDEMTMTFKSFDGDHVTIYGEGESCPGLAIIDHHGHPVSEADWWLRHVVGSELTVDL